MLRHFSFLTTTIFAILSLVTFSSMHAQPTEKEAAAGVSKRFAIVLHGGAGGEPDTWSDDYKQRRRESLGKALDAGIATLSPGGSALDAVEAVIRVLEDDPMFNAGRGCVLNDQGDHELDASIMDGRTLACGAVASLKVAKNPISVARHVMTDTPHVLLIGSGADRFAESLGVELAAASYFKTEEQVQAWMKWKAKQAEKQKGAAIQEERYLGTVGCVAVDSQGNIAAGTSTGGLMGKRWGRVGDSPIIGAGTYAANATCGVSCTGTGEEFIRHNVAADMAARVRYKSQSVGGIVTRFNTAAMARASADSSGRREIRIARESD
jgi:beta-aspartyl-peptidase (threonine type)